MDDDVGAFCFVEMSARPSHVQQHAATALPATASTQSYNLGGQPPYFVHDPGLEAEFVQP